MTGTERVRIPRRRLLSGLPALCAGALAGCSPAAVLNALAPDRLAADGIAYGPEPRQRLDVYRPAGIGPFPVAVFLYGGRWESGDRALYRFVGAALAAQGFLVVIPDYRLFPAVRYPDFLQDCALALAWTRRQAASFGGRPGRCWLIGHSAGAYNAAMLTLDGRWLGGIGSSPSQALLGTVGLAGPYDFLPLTDPDVRAIFAPAEPLRSSQPIAHAAPDRPPMLLLAGRADRTVDPGNSVRLAARLGAVGGRAELRLYPGIDHVEIIGAFAAPLRFLAPSLRDSVRFMRRQG